MSHRNGVALRICMRLAASALLASMVLPSQAQDRIILDGSTGMLPLAKTLADAYQQRSSDLHIELGKGLGTGARLRALADGKIHIALASHGVSAAELQKDRLKLVPVAKGAIVFGVNASVPVSNLTEAQVCDLFSGRVRDWRAFGGPEGSVAVLTRPPTEVDPEVIREKIACFKGLKEVDTAKIMPRGGDMAKGLAETAQAIGMTSLTVVQQSGGKVKALALNGISPTSENVKAGRYSLTRDFLFVVREAPTPAIQKFLDFVLGPEGDRIIAQNGAIPVR